MRPGVRRLIERVAGNAPDRFEGGASLILAPHPDDEVLGCGGTIAKRVGQGHPVYIAFLTDGRLGVPDRPDEAQAIREEEATRAAAVLGLAPGALTFLRVEDGQLAASVDPMIGRVGKLIDDLGVAELFAPYRSDYHPDHIAAWRIAEACRPMVRRLYEYPIWFGPWLWSRLGWKARLAASAHLADLRRAVKVDVGNVLTVKRAALGAYRSQVAAFGQLGPWGREFLMSFQGRYELFFTSTGSRQS